jgi:phage gpG-like protein
MSAVLSIALTLAASVALSLRGAAPLRAWLRGVLERLGQRARLHRRGGQALADWAERNFAADGRLATETSAGWPRLSAATLAARRAAGLGTRPLQATGRLRAGMRLRSGAGEASLDNPVPYAATHQLGLGLPARPFLPTRVQAGAVLRPVAQAFVREALRGSAPAAPGSTAGGSAAEEGGR